MVAAATQLAASEVSPSPRVSSDVANLGELMAAPGVVVATGLNMVVSPAATAGTSVAPREAVNATVQALNCEGCVAVPGSSAIYSKSASTAQPISPPRTYVSSASETAALRLASLPPGVWLLVAAFAGLVGVARRKEHS